MAEFEPLLEALAREVTSVYGDRLVSLVLYGSVARSTAGPLSDVDFLVIASPLPSGRGARLREFEPVDRAMEPFLADLRSKGFRTSLSPVFKTPDEVERGSLLFLDLTLEARMLVDRGGFFERYLDRLRERLARLGSRRVPFKGGYYWLLKPDIQPGEVIEL